jgi:hypothetical protein
VKALVKPWLLSGCIAALLSCAGCIGPQYSKHNLIISGKPAPEIHGPRDPALQASLTTNMWPLQPFAGSAAEVGTTLIKSAGVQGWKDYHMYAQAKGIAIQHKFTSGPYMSLDMRLQSLTVNRVPVPLRGPKYMRLVIFLGKISVAAAVYERTNAQVFARGKLVWNSDGWLEIHPKKTGDVELIPKLPPRPNENIPTAASLALQ